MGLDIGTIIGFIKIGKQVVDAGRPAYESLRQALAKHGIETDSEELDAIIIDAAHRKAVAEREAEG